MSVIIRYHSKKEKKIVSAFVDLIPLIEATGRDFFEAMSECIESIGLKMKDCNGLECDGASVMIGEHNSVWSRMKTAAPNCIWVKCICHSSALCVKYAFEKLPSSLGYLLAEITKWFSKRSLRRDAFQTLFSLMNPDDERKRMPSPFEKYSKTRWLMRGKVIYNCLVNWEELKAYFAAAEHASSQDARYKACTILEMLNDPVNLLYFHFVSNLVTEFENVNAFYQATDADPEEMQKELSLHYKTLRSRTCDVHGNLLPLNKERKDCVCEALLLHIFALRKNEETEKQTSRLTSDVNLLRKVSEKMDTFCYKLSISLLVLWSIAIL
eukprot:gene16-606_t